MYKLDHEIENNYLTMKILEAEKQKLDKMSPNKKD